MIDVGVCEDDTALREVICRGLACEDFDVRATATGAEALGMFAARPPHVLILDIGLPDIDGREVCRRLRAGGFGSPVLFLTAYDGLPDRLSGFHAGGDDYLAKPFAFAELVVRVEALWRRHRPRPQGAFDVVLDPARHALSHGDQHVLVTPTEFRLSAALLAAPGELVRREALMQTAWPVGARVHPNTLDAYIQRIRRKLRAVDASVQITAVRGVGYILREAPGRGDAPEATLTLSSHTPRTLDG